jgi:hypothetical protein
VCNRVIRFRRLAPLVWYPPIDTNEICAGAPRFGTFSSSFRPPLGDEFGNEIAISRDVAGNNALRLL